MREQNLFKEKETHKYDDIIHLPHHVSVKHPQMALLDRAAQFSPFAALTGHEDSIRETARRTEDFLELDEGMMKHHHVFSIEEKIDLHEAIKNLRPEYQSVIHLKYFDDLSIEEIATQLGMSSNTVKSHLRRGKRELRLMLKEGSC